MTRSALAVLLLLNLFTAPLRVDAQPANPMPPP
jgi:hypothetical protein